MAGYTGRTPAHPTPSTDNLPRERKRDSGQPQCLSSLSGRRALASGGMTQPGAPRVPQALRRCCRERPPDERGPLCLCSRPPGFIWYLPSSLPPVSSDHHIRSASSEDDGFFVLHLPWATSSSCPWDPPASSRLCSGFRNLRSLPPLSRFTAIPDLWQAGLLLTFYFFVSLHLPLPSPELPLSFIQGFTAPPPGPMPISHLLSVASGPHIQMCRWSRSNPLFSR